MMLQLHQEEEEEEEEEEDEEEEEEVATELAINFDCSSSTQLVRWRV